MKLSLKLLLVAACVCAFLFPVQIQAQSLSPSSRTWTENPADVMNSDPLAGWRRAGLEGYTDKNSVTQGQAITFYVSVRNDLLPTNYNVEIYRVGATDVYKATVSGGPFTGQFFPLHDKNNQEVFPSDAGNPNKVPIEHRIGCNWPSAFTLNIPSNWPSGFYYAKLITTSTPAKFGAIPFVVKEDNPGSTSNMLVVIAWNTYVAYNYFGGGSLYWWTAQFDNSEKAYIDTVSFRRPFGYHLHDCCVQSDSLGQFNQRERRFINWAESASNGYTLEYCIDRDIDQDDPLTQLPLLSKYKAVLFPGHSEYWSLNMRRNTSDESTNLQQTTFMKSGGNVVFFAANNCYWKIDYLTNGTNGLRMHSKKYDLSYLWRRQPEGPEAQWLAVQFHGTNYPGPNSSNIVKNQNHWIFQGTNLVNEQAFGLGNPSQGIDEVAAGEVDQTRTNISPSNREVLAKVFIRELIDPMETHYGEVDSIFSEMAYWEDPATNARVFSAAGLGWCNALYGTDGDKLGIMTTNILEHFSFEKYRGNIYTDLIWGDEALETATILDGDTYVLAGRKLTLSNNFLLTISPGVTLYVQGTLVIGSNVTITGGGKIVTSGSGLIKTESTTSLATAFNNSRKIARDASGNYHIVFDAGGEICYEKWANNGTELKEFRRLSGSNGNNAYACIAERGGKVYVVWQRQDGSTYDVHFRKSATGGTTWGPTTELFSNISQSTMLPVITSAATNKLMLVCRGGSGSTLRFRTSDDDGVTWAVAAAVPSSNSSDGYPTLAPTTSNSGGAREALAYSRSTSPGTIYYRYYMHGPDTTGWNAAVRNLSAVVPGTYNTHQRPSLAPSGTSSNKQLHVAWEAINQSSVRVVIHRKATNWYTWPSVYSVTYDNLNQQQLPSITGLANATAAMVFRPASQNNILRMNYTGSQWCVAEYIDQGFYPSVSMGNTSAKYVYPMGTAPPYQIKLGNETLNGVVDCIPTLSKTTAQNELGLLYHRSVAVLDTVTNAWLELRLNEISVKTLGGDELLLPFETAQEDSLTLTPARAFVNLASSAFTLPADAESLFVSCLIGGQRLSSLKNGNTVNLSLAFTGRNGGSRSLPLVATNSDSISITTLKLAARITSFANSEASLRATVAGLGNKPTMIASLGHLYEITSQGLSKQTALVNQIARPRTFEVQVHPNPFNPSTQIHFYLSAENVVAVRVYDVNGRMVKGLVDGFRMAGDYTVTWDGRDELGKTVASGMYFSQVSFGEERKVAKMILVR